MPSSISSGGGTASGPTAATSRPRPAGAGSAPDGPTAEVYVPDMPIILRPRAPETRAGYRPLDVPEPAAVRGLSTGERAGTGGGARVIDR
ncbi:hypothetical protein Pen02_37620 [Plantactinospora endophytica]|uniref:Uncharacterized protein n=1 Tax=Plantactinospora endophytica TaxID=673535 RepID=A0ABQ4E2D4_9ACTN|nr:hypothetical protein Pen02_37620 [Plantactinospora endophytica]